MNNIKLKSGSYYKIRHKTTGLFSMGGCNPSWSKLGKVWRGNTLKSHLSLHANTSYSSGYANNIPEEWEVVEMLIEYVKICPARSLYPETK